MYKPRISPVSVLHPNISTLTLPQLHPSPPPRSCCTLVVQFPRLTHQSACSHRHQLRQQHFRRRHHPGGSSHQRPLHRRQWDSGVVCCPHELRRRYIQSHCSLLQHHQQHLHHQQGKGKTISRDCVCQPNLPSAQMSISRYIYNVCMYINSSIGNVVDCT